LAIIRPTTEVKTGLFATVYKISREKVVVKILQGSVDTQCM